MKVKELRRQLKDFDGDLDVKFRYHDASYGETYEDVEELGMHGETASLSGTIPEFVYLL